LTFIITTLTVDFTNPAGFGLSLVGMMARQLKGTLRIVRGNGTKIVLEFRREEIKI